MKGYFSFLHSANVVWSHAVFKYALIIIWKFSSIGKNSIAAVVLTVAFFAYGLTVSKNIAFELV